MYKLKADPTFTIKVEFPVAGKPSVPVDVTFKHRTGKELDAWRQESEGRPAVDVFMECVIGWGLTEEFTRENVEILLDNHIGVQMAVYVAYITELTKHKEKN